MTNQLHKEIDRLKQHVLALVAEVEENLRKSVDALEQANPTLANEVIAADRRIDRLEVDLEEECLKILALYQPVATDLRFIIAVLKINNEIERISDLGVNIAERAAFLAKGRRVSIPFDFSVMADKAQDMLRSSINALVTLDSNRAVEVCAADDEVDALNRDMYEIVKDCIRKNVDDVNELIHYLSISRHLERVADHATNIAEDVIYLIDGEIVRHNVENYHK